MRKALLIIIVVFIGLSAKVNAQIVNIPDGHFKAALIANGVHDSAGYITADTAKLFTGKLNVSSYSITDLTGISAFNAITYLDCSSNSLTSLDVSSNLVLDTLYCYSNSLTSLNVSSNIALTYLDCFFNSLTSLGVSSDLVLNNLNCNYNSLTSLDLSHNIALTGLGCSDNDLTSLDVSSNTALTILNCSGNDLTSLNVSSNTALIVLQCGDDGLTSLDVSSNSDLISLWCYSNKLASLDLSSDTALIALDCRENSLTSLNVKNGNNLNMTNDDFDATLNDSLYCIQVDNVAYSTANWGAIDKWASFSTNCNYPNAVNELSSIADVSIYPNPATDQLTITGNWNTSQNYILTITNLLGEAIYIHAVNSKQETVNCKQFPSGLYFLRLANDEKSWVGKFVKE